jgi:hypothetical protein
VDLVYAQPVTADLREHVALVVTELNRQRGLEPWAAAASGGRRGGAG